MARHGAVHAHASKQYNQGADFEREIRKDFEARGYIAVRSAGSHGKFDVWATNGRALYLIQAKKGMSEVAAKKLLQELTDYMRGNFPVIMMPIAVLIAVGMKNGKLVVYGKAYLPRTEQELKDAVTNLNREVEKRGSESN